MDADRFRFLIERIGRETGREYILVVGASAIVPLLRPNPAVTLTRTHDVDVFIDVDDSEQDRISFLLGEGSPFEEMHGIYAQPVDFETPRFAPRHWVSHTLAFRFEGVTALCMEPHDLALSKYGAGREKDLEFTRVLAAEGYIQKETLLSRLNDVECTEALRGLIRIRIEADFANTG